MIKLNKIAEAVGKVSDVFKEGQKQKKWSAKRSVSGVLVTASVTDMANNGLNEYNVALAFIAVLPLCFTAFTRYEKRV